MVAHMLIVIELLFTVRLRVASLDDINLVRDCLMADRELYKVFKRIFK